MLISFSGVIRDIPPAALELERRRGKDLFQRALALKTFLGGGIGDLLEDLKDCPAFRAFKFV